ncbi:sulfurtransferase complex subunit TusD [Paraglaciecola aquimarina]|uniref:Sulfurtransferase complex subunit TusD n=1 Tax=Paraglaciecola algarum TaxID=3050085 RepID=A0ABS9D4U2_9ALTE|nr:sulfurtransferase complex subunit TusD [Paraglaciecola sp. G1-23]MCF2947048.1 sulfurtransferase complex subunit TusD [Paraglaciecola sp. G1-23]
MASFTLLVTSAPFSDQGSNSAYRFSLAALEAGHTINGVFFYENGTLNGNSLQISASDEFDLLNAWQALVTQHKVPLKVCVNAATKRGVTNAQDAEESDKLHFSLSNNFESVGLGDLAVLIKDSDRLVQF